MRRSNVFFLVLAVLSGLLGLAALHAGRGRSAGLRLLIVERSMVQEYGLSDLCLFTEASYTRHPSLTDPIAPFQDGPHSLEHFPSGSLVARPPSLLVTWRHD